jgi:addiction module HigA family antidote
MQQDYRMKSPVHPGLLVKMEILDEFGLTVTAAAKILGVTRPALSALVNERAQLSPEMALRLEKAFGWPMDTLLRMQMSYDIARIRNRADDIHLERFKPNLTPEADDPAA